MSSKCGKCFSEFDQGQLVAKCIECGGEFHPSCTQLGAQNFTKAKSKVWKCETCAVETSSTTSQRSEAASADVIDKKTFFDALNNFRNDIKNHTDAAVGGVIKKLDKLQEDVQSLTTQLKGLEENQQVIEKRCDTLDQACASLHAASQSAMLRLDDAEQYSRCANIEVVGIPVSPGENIYAVLQKLAAAIGVTYKREDISIAHRLRHFSKAQVHPPIICQFVSRTSKAQWLAAAKTKRNPSLKSTDISPNLATSNVYINDHLTSHNKALLGRARRLQREGKIHFAGYFNGKILVKPRESDNAVRIFNLEDMDKYEKK